MTIRAKSLPVSVAEAAQIQEALNKARSAGKVETPKPVEKPKFRPVIPFKQGRTAMPGEARELANSDGFKAMCLTHNIAPTRRQAAKYIQKRGALWNSKHVR